MGAEAARPDNRAPSPMARKARRLRQLQHQMAPHPHDGADLRGTTDVLQFTVLADGALLED